MDNKNELMEYCCELEDIELKDKPLEYDENIDYEKIMLDVAEIENEKLEEFDNKIHVQEQETLEAGDCIISTKLEAAENIVYVIELNEDCDMNNDALLVTQNMETITANGDILYNCPRCTYSSHSRYNHKRHVQRHDNIRKFACTVCERRFYEKQKLQQHMLTHSGQKVFVCSLCDYGAIQKEHLRRHLQNKHTKIRDKKYKCSKCSYQTNNKGQMGKHRFVHQEGLPYVCETCNRQFHRTCELKAHGLVHKEKRYKCVHCDYKTNMKTRLVIHLKCKHLGLKRKE